MLHELIILTNCLFRIVAVNLSRGFSTLNRLLLASFLLLKLLQRVQLGLYLHLYISHIGYIIIERLIGLIYLISMRHCTPSRSTNIVLWNNSSWCLVNALYSHPQVLSSIPRLSLMRPLMALQFLSPVVQLLHAIVYCLNVLAQVIAIQIVSWSSCRGDRRNDRPAVELSGPSLRVRLLAAWVFL